MTFWTLLCFFLHFTFSYRLPIMCLRMVLFCMGTQRTDKKTYNSLLTKLIYLCHYCWLKESEKQHTDKLYLWQALHWFRRKLQASDPQTVTTAYYALFECTLAPRPRRVCSLSGDMVQWYGTEPPKLIRRESTFIKKEQ